jgi:subtilisin family serine protease
MLFSTLILILFISNTANAELGFVDNSSQNFESNEYLLDDFSFSNWNRDKNHNRLDDLLDEKIALGSTKPVNIYINYRSRPTADDVELLNTLSINISYQAKYIPTICAREVPLAKVQKLLTIPGIAMIEQQPFLVPALDVSAGSIKARESVEYSPETAWELGYSGQDVVIAILDTGVDDRHESLQGKFIAGYDCTLRIPVEINPDDEDGHGTHVAGIAMGTGGEDGQYMGIAPAAKLVDVKVLSDWGVSPGDQIVHGIEWCIERKDDYNINILSMSIGEMFTGNDNGQGTQGLLVNTAAAAGLVMVVAGGNDGPNNNGFSSLAAADDAITVGAIDEMESVDRSDDEIASFSNRGPRASDGDESEVDEYKPDVVAPGVGIMSAWGSPVGTAGLGYIAQSGTSMACPHVAGMIGLMLEANPNLTPQQIKQILHDTSEARGHTYHVDNDPKYSKDYGWGIIDCFEAVRKIVGEDYQFVDVDSHNPYEEVYNVITVQGTASVSKGTIDLVEYKIEDSAWQSAEGTDSWEFSWDTTTVENGEHIIYLRSFDGIEYSRELSLPLKVINIGCRITNPENGSAVKDTVLIQGTSFGSGVIEVLIKIGDGFWILVEGAEVAGNLSKWEYTLDTNDLDNGIYILSVKAFNGNWYSIPISIEVEVINPEDDSGFLPGFEGIFILLGILLLLIFNSRRRNMF